MVLKSLVFSFVFAGLLFLPLCSCSIPKISRSNHSEITRTRSLRTLGNVVNVNSFRALGRGSDDTQAFQKAWEKACNSKNSVLVVPKGRIYHIKPIRFSGPCKPGLKMQIQGNIRASPHISDYEQDRRHWIIFEDLSDFTVQGGGTLSGNGQVWWKNSCKIDKTKPCIGAPTAVTFYKCTNLQVKDLSIKNAQQMHMNFEQCKNVVASNLRITAPGKSPNTDGIHVTSTQNLQINNCIIGTGDDCISIVDGSKNIQAKGIKCGPGHGISIGSLGKQHANDQVSDIYVDGATFTGTTNGVRIKSWQGGQGYAKNIFFQNIMMKNVSNPIIIDQYYCDQKEPCPEQKSAVQVNNILYKNIKGTSATDVAIKLDCSKTVPCSGIRLENVNLVRQGRGKAEAKCSNLKSPFFNGKISPFPSCL